MAPKNNQELSQMVKFASSYNDGPIAIRYPRGNEDDNVISLNSEDIKYGKSEVLIQEDTICIICVGSMVSVGVDLHDKLKQQGLRASLINVRFIKPVDEELLVNLGNTHKEIIVIEENVIIGGYGSEVLRIFNNKNIKCSVKLYGIEDEFVEHGNRDTLLELCGLTSENIYNNIINNRFEGE
jgi:1-deoxy-D-xylulose-5-phosphate synthase